MRALALDRAQYAGAPAMVMALGIFLNYALKFLLREAGVAAVPRVAEVLAYGLLALAAWVFLTMGRTFRGRWAALWQPDAGRFVLGTWPAGLNVLAVSLAVNTGAPWLARAVNLLAWLAWLMYMAWFVALAVRNPAFPRGLQGPAFLLTVSTQSTVIGTLNAWGAAPGGAAFFLVLIGLGLAFYLFVFAAVWVLGGLRRVLAGWQAPVNITHGALSISVLALATVAAAYPAVPALPAALNALWLAASAFLAAVLALEATLLASGRGRALLGFHYGNYARNFTFGMYFAATFFSAARIDGFLGGRWYGEGAFLALALWVLALNAWETGRHFFLFLRAETADR